MSRLLLNQGTAPSAPASGKSALYVDSSDRRVKVIDDLGVTSVLSSSGLRGKNILVNGGFDFAQRQVPTTLTSYTLTADRTYGYDRWGMSIQASNLQPQQVDTTVTPQTGVTSKNIGSFKQITALSKTIVSQVIEAIDCMPLRGRIVRFQAKIKYGPGTATIRMGLIQNNASATQDVIVNPWTTAWGANTVDPTLGANLALVPPIVAENATIVNNALTCAATTSWQRFSGTFLVPTTCVNLIVAFWTDSQMAINDFLYLAEVGLYDGQEIRDWNPLPVAFEYQRCLRYYCKTFPLLTAPAQSGGVTGALRFIAGKAGATAQFGQWTFPTRMRGTPSTVTLYNPSAGNAQARDVTASQDSTGAAAASTNDTGLDINCTGNAGDAVGDEMKIHITASAEIGGSN